MSVAPAFTASDPDFAARITGSFSRQAAMATFGARLTRVAAGEIEIVLKVAPHLAQQHGFVHGGVVAAIADSAAGYAALSLMPKGRGVLTAEFKINFLAPAAGDELVARGRVVKPGRTLSLAMAEVFALDAGREKLCALLTATMMAVEGWDGVAD